jgi:tRNA(fMet)-specific endonuclease VapC
MVVLDTDHVSLLDKADSPEGIRLRDRLEAVPPDARFVTIISYEEQTRGWLARVSRARKPRERVEAYARLKRHLDGYRSIAVLPFDEAANHRFEELEIQKLHIGTQDLRIAAICLAHNATLLTRNLRDFKKVPGLKAEDWTK